MKAATRKTAALSGSALALLTILFLTGRSLISAPLMSKDEQDVIEAAIAQSPEVASEKEHLLYYNFFDGVCCGRTRDELAKEFRASVARDQPDLIGVLETFIARNNRARTKIRFPRPLPKNIRLLTSAEIRTGSKENGGNYYPSIFRRFPGTKGIISVSRPAIDPSGTTAIIALQYYSSPMSGAGQILVFQRIEGRWIFQPDRSFGGGWMS